MTFLFTYESLVFKALVYYFSTPMMILWYFLVLGHGPIHVFGCLFLGYRMLQCGLLDNFRNYCTLTQPNVFSDVLDCKACLNHLPICDSFKLNLTVL